MFRLLPGDSLQASVSKQLYFDTLQLLLLLQQAVFFQRYIFLTRFTAFVPIHSSMGFTPV